MDTPSLDKAQVDQYAKAMREAALKTAAAQMAVNVGLMFVPIVGWAVGLVYGLVTIFAGRYDKAKIKEVQDAMVDAINRIAAGYSAQYDAQVSAVYAQEEANALAEIQAEKTASAQGVGQLDLDFSSFGHAVAKTFSQIQTAVPRAVGITVLKIAQTGATLVGDKKAATRLSSGETQWINLASRGTNALTHDITHGNDAIAHAGDTARMLTGEQQVFEARKQASIIEDQFLAKMKDQYALQVAQIQSPSFRAALRDAIKTLLRAQPGVADALSAHKTKTMVIAAAGAAVVGWFAFRR